MANFYRIGAAGLDWKTVGSWSTTSGGASNGIDEPTSLDDVRFDGNSPVSATITTTAVCASAIFTKDVNITLNGANLTINGLLSISTNIDIYFYKTTSEGVTVTNGITMTAVNAFLGGTVILTLTGGTWIGNATSSNCTLEVVMTPSSSNITMSTAIRFTGTKLSYIASTFNVIATSSTFYFGGTTCNLDLNGMSLGSIIPIQSINPVLTLLSNLTVSAIVLNGVNHKFVFNRTTSETVTVTNGMSLSATSNGGLSGTADIYLTGGTWSSTVIVTGHNGVANNLFLQGNVTISGTVQYTNGTLKYVSGSITTTGSTLLPIGNCTVDSAGVLWNHVTNVTGIIITLTSLLSAESIYLVGTTVTFSGTHGFNCSNLYYDAITSCTINFASSITYTITSLFSCYLATVGTILFTSGGTANLVMSNNGNNLCNVNASFTNINASGGRTITTFGGTITSCTNINQYFDYKSIAA